jgi:HKD family nuclease
MMESGESVDHKIVNSSRTSFIDRTFDSEDSFRSKLIYNDYKNGSKVLSELSKELYCCESFSFSVAFVTMSGLTCLLQEFAELREHGVKGRILTTDYLNFSEPRALLKILEFDNIETRVYTKDNFHAKGYIFHKSDVNTILIGSSNLTQDALCKNKEWNLKVNSTENGELLCNVLSEFDEMWKYSEVLTKRWIDEYIPRYETIINARKIEIKAESGAMTIIPNMMQQNAMRSLEDLRAKGKNKALLISATGTGKTYLSAFDAYTFKPKRMLFLVHRDKILNDAINTF